MSKKTVVKLKNYLARIIEDSPYCDKWFYQEHILVVEKLAMKLCDEYPKANREAVTLMVYLHDIGRADNHNENHDIYGSEYAHKLLSENEFPTDFVSLVAQGCKTHSCDNFGQPASLEGKILATADAMSHFQQGFYLRIFYAWSQKSTDKQDFAHLKKKIFAKMNRDFNNKIFFPEAKKAVLPLYQAWQKAMEEIKF